MGRSSEQQNAWQTEATAAAVAAVRAIIASDYPLTHTLAGKLTDQQLGWIISTGIFGWIKTRYQQAVSEGLDKEQHVIRMDPSPRDSAIVRSILSRLCDQARIDWSKPLAAWSKEEMTGFIETAWRLISEASAALGDFPELPESLKLTQEERRAAWDDFDQRKKNDPSIKVTAQRSNVILNPAERMDDGIPF